MTREFCRANKKVYLTLTFEPANQLIYVNWKGFLTEQQIVSGSEELLKMIRESCCKKILVDNSNIFGPWQSTNSWYQQNWNPRAAAEGLKHVAFVMSSDLFSQLSIQGYAKIAKGILNVNILNSEEAARQWLNDQV